MYAIIINICFQERQTWSTTFSFLAPSYMHNSRPGLSHSTFLSISAISVCNIEVEVCFLSSPSSFNFSIYSPGHTWSPTPIIYTYNLENLQTLKQENFSSRKWNGKQASVMDNDHEKKQKLARYSPKEDFCFIVFCSFFIKWDGIFVFLFKSYYGVKFIFAFLPVFFFSHWGLSKQSCPPIIYLRIKSSLDLVPNC